MRPKHSVGLAERLRLGDSNHSVWGDYIANARNDVITLVLRKS
ncbi:MAG: hypothetical protein AAFX80_06660 [Cyanobacteria bacterium J06639_18]